MNGWVTPKDLILHLAGKLTVRVRPLSVIVHETMLTSASRAELDVSSSILVLEFSHSHALVRLSMLTCECGGAVLNIS